MRTKLVRIGNSQGLRLPKPILEASGIRDEVDLAVEGGRIVLTRPRQAPREGWAEAISAIGLAGEDEAEWLDAPLEADDEWDWPEDFAWPQDPDVLTFTLLPSTPSEGPRSPRHVPAPSSRRTR